jgi:hypothetical protein
LRSIQVGHRLPARRRSKKGLLSRICGSAAARADVQGRDITPLASLDKAQAASFFPSDSALSSLRPSATLRERLSARGRRQRDNFGWLLADVYVGEIYVQQHMLDTGHAVIWRP